METSDLPAWGVVLIYAALPAGFALTWAVLALIFRERSEGDAP